MLGICYRPWDQKYHKDEEMAHESKRACDKGKTILMGDFNVNWYESEVRLWLEK